MTTAGADRLPTFLIIGAAKCGTTSLHRYLDLHPEVGMSRLKEPHFFNGREPWSRGVGWYASLFDPAFAQRGESSVGYSAFPHTPGVPERIAAVIPDVKLVYLVRDPLDRLVSDHLHRVSDGREDRSLDAAVLDMAGTRLGDRGRYFFQLSQYLARFDRERILVLPSERLRRDRAASLARVFRFLGIDPAFTTPAFDRELHQSRHFRRKNAVGRLLKRAAESGPASIVPAHVRREIGQIAYRPFSRALHRPVLGSKARAFAREFYREDVAALQDFLDDRIPEWTDWHGGGRRVS